MHTDLLEQISIKTGLTKDQVVQVTDELLTGLHSRLESANRDYIGTDASYELGDRAYYHLLGLFDQFSSKYGWKKGDAGQYLGRMPPMDRWKQFRNEIDAFAISEEGSNAKYKGVAKK